MTSFPRSSGRGLEDESAGVAFGGAGELPFGFSDIEIFKVGTRAGVVRSAHLNDDTLPDCVLIDNAKGSVCYLLQRAEGEAAEPEEVGVNEVPSDARFRRVDKEKTFCNTVEVVATIKCRIAIDAFWRNISARFIAYHVDAVDVEEVLVARKRVLVFTEHMIKHFLDMTRVRRVDL